MERRGDYDVFEEKQKEFAKIIRYKQAVWQD